MHLYRLYKTYLSILFATISLSAYSQPDTIASIEKLPYYLQEQLNQNLLIQADSGNYEKVKNLLELGIGPNISTWSGVTPLMYASQNGYYSIAKELIAHYADINSKTIASYTALHYATMFNHDSIAEMLILNGADVHPVNSHGIAPLHYACAYGYPFMTDLLLWYGAAIDSADRYGNTPLITAAYSGSIITTEILLERWADVDKSDKNGFTPLMVAAQFNDTTLVRLLTDYGANISSRNKHDATALAIAISSGSVDVAKMLLNRGAANEELMPNTSYADLSHNYQQNELKRLLQDQGSKLSQVPKLSTTSLSSGFAFNSNDLYITLDLKSTIATYRLHLGITMGFRPYYKPVLVEKEYESYQFFEQRNFITTHLAKELFSINWRQSDVGMALGIIGFRSWGNYSYYKPLTKPKVYNMASPLVTFYLYKGKLNIETKAYILPMDHIRKQPIIFDITFGYTFNHTKPKIVPKRIEWL